MSQFYDQASLVMVPSGYKAGKVYSQKPLSTDGELTFTRNSNATRVNADGLVEKVRTNYLTYSNDLTNAAWVLENSATIASGATDLEGGTTAFTLTKTAVQYGRVRQNLTWSGSRTFSLYVKAGTLSKVTIQIGGGVAVFDLSTQTFSTNTISADYIDKGSGWFLLYGYATGPDVRIYPDTYTATTAGNIIVWHPQLEETDFGPTQYIPTTSAAVSVGPTANVPRLNYSNGCPSLLLEPQRTNLALWSEAFGNAIWNISNLTVTSNTSETLDPSGYYGAEKITANSLTGNHFIRQAVTVTASTTYTSSVFIKAGNTNVFSLADGYNINILATFDLSAVTATNVNGTNAKIESVGNGWYRCSASMVPTSTTMGLMVYSGTTYAGTETDKYYYIWGAQLEAGSYATSYIPTGGSGASVTRLADAAYKTGISSLIGQTEGTLFVEASALVNGGDSRRISLSDGTISNRISLEYDEDASRIRAFMSAAGTTVGTTSYTGVNQTSDIKIAVTYSVSSFSMFINGEKVDSDTVIASTPSGMDSVKFEGGTGNPFHGNVKQLVHIKTALTDAQAIELTTL